VKQQITEKPQENAAIVGMDDSIFTNLAATLTEIRKLKGVTGYILRNNTAAIIDLAQKEFVTEYAMLSQEIQDCSKGVLKQFNLADVESVLVEGKAVKALCMSLGENSISVFMDKACAHGWIVKRILL
jgi:predicted regulator of Ras-like GTPase activity (Roadblock/LC7/MglB family)